MVGFPGATGTGTPALVLQDQNHWVLKMATDADVAILEKNLLHI